MQSLTEFATHQWTPHRSETFAADPSPRNQRAVGPEPEPKTFRWLKPKPEIWVPDFTEIVCGASELHKYYNAFFLFFWTKLFWTRSQKI